MKLINQELINQVVEKIVHHFKPLKIILFGSCATGQIDENSDLDLFIIMESDLRRDQRAIEISHLFADRLFPMDIIVYTPAEVELSLKRGNPFTKEILTQGKVLYG